MKITYNAIKDWAMECECTDCKSSMIIDINDVRYNSAGYDHYFVCGVCEYVNYIGDSLSGPIKKRIKEKYFSNE